MESKNNYKKAFQEIKSGFSKIDVLETTFFLKHISFGDQVDIDEIYDRYLDQAKKRGIPEHEQVLKHLLEEGQWSQKQENLIKKQEDFVKNLIAQKKAIYLKSEIDRINTDIENGQKDLNDLKNARSSLFMRTAESYAEERVNDHYILKCLYKDQDLKQKAYTEEEFDEIDQQTLFSIIKEYNRVYKYLNDDFIQKIVLDEFFGLFMPFAENAMEFYGQPICSLSYNQIKILIYARFFKTVFQKYDKMPEDIRKDPDKIMDYINANENARKMMEKRGNKENSAQSIVGANSEDLEYLGVKAKGERTLSLADEAKKKGGSLSMEDMMKLFG